MLTRKVYGLQNPGHIEEIARWLEENEEDDPILNEDLGEESDVASEDEVEQRDGDSETEQEGESDHEDDADNSFFWGKIILLSGIKILQERMYVEVLII